MGICGIFIKTCKDFWASTSIAGASNAHNAKSNARKAYWTVLFLIGLAATAYAVYQVTYDYLQYPVSTTIRLERLNNVHYPAVTVCNQNRVDCIRLEAVISICNQNSTKCPLVTENALEVVENIFNMACRHSDTGRKKRRKRGLLDTLNGDDGLLGSEGLLDLDGTEEVLGETPKSVDREYKFLNEYSKLLKADKILIGHSFNTFIQSCIFREKNCLNESYGNCYTFNSAMNENDFDGGRRVSSMSGPAFGLSLILNIHQDAYMVNGQTKQAGARFIVHNPEQSGLPIENGFDLHPNTLTSAAIKEISISRLSDPYPANCSDSWKRTNYTDYVPNDFGWNYTLPLCTRLCMHLTFQSECGCYHPLYRDNEYPGSKNTDYYRSCNLVSGSNDSVCVANIISQLDDGARNCSCNVDCQEKNYEVALSESLWPSKQYLPSAKNRFGYENASAERANIQDNLLQLSTYFTTLNVQLVEESPVYSLSDSSLIAAYGGALSLYLGVALIMIFEILEFFIDFFVNVYQYFVRGKKTFQHKRSGAKSGKL